MAPESPHSLPSACHVTSTSLPYARAHRPQRLAEWRRWCAPAQCGLLLAGPREGGRKRPPPPLPRARHPPAPACRSG